jgi:hypothetical protein
MLNVQQEALGRAQALLSAAKVDFAIRMPDGTTLGTLAVMPPKKVKLPKTPRTVQYHWDRDYQYIEKIAALKPGDTLVFEVPAEGGEHFRGAVSGTCSRKHGPRNCIVATEWKDNRTKMRVEVLRVQ